MRFEKLIPRVFFLTAVVCLAGCLTPSGDNLSRGGKGGGSTAPTPTPTSKQVSLTQSGVCVVSSTGNCLSSGFVYRGKSITVKLLTKDFNGIPLGVGGANVAFTVSSGSFSAVTDHGDGSYSAIYTPSAAGAGIQVQGSINGQAVLQSPASLTSIQSPLEHYQSDFAVKSVVFSGSNLSGQTFSLGTNSIFWIRNNDKIVYESSPTFGLLRTIALDTTGASADFEDLTYLGMVGNNPEFALVNEAGELLVGVIGGDRNATDKPLLIGSMQKLNFSAGNGNTGPEGIAYDAVKKRFYACQEKGPLKVFQFDRPADPGNKSYANGTLTVTEPFDAQAKLGSVITDISSCHFDERTGRLLILSDESQRVLDVDLAGNIVGTLVIDGSQSQYEGITLDKAGNLILSSEPSLYRTYTYGFPPN